VLITEETAMANDGRGGGAPGKGNPGGDRGGNRSGEHEAREPARTPGNDQQARGKDPMRGKPG
jgi:hypothetical protein